MKEGDVEQAAYWLGYLCSLSVDSHRRHLRLARIRAREAPSTSSLLDLGDSLALSGKMDEARTAYEQAIELSNTAVELTRDLDRAIAQLAEQAIAAMNNGQLPPFVEHNRASNRPLAVRYAASYEHWKREAERAPTAVAFQNLALACEGMDRFADALVAYKTALQYVSENDEATRESLECKVKTLSKDIGQ